MSQSNGNDKPVLNIEPKVNVGLRTAILVLLCCQNAGHALLTRYSQGNDYDTSTATLTYCRLHLILFLIILHLREIFISSSCNHKQETDKLKMFSLLKSSLILSIIMFFLPYIS
jgi:hypothetical protein